MFYIANIARIVTSWTSWVERRQQQEQNETTHDARLRPNKGLEVGVREESDVGKGSEYGVNDGYTWFEIGLQARLRNVLLIYLHGLVTRVLPRNPFAYYGNAQIFVERQRKLRSIFNIRIFPTLLAVACPAFCIAPRRWIEVEQSRGAAESGPYSHLPGASMETPCVQFDGRTDGVSSDSGMPYFIFTPTTSLPIINWTYIARGAQERTVKYYRKRAPREETWEMIHIDCWIFYCELFRIFPHTFDAFVDVNGIALDVGAVAFVVVVVVGNP